MSFPDTTTSTESYEWLNGTQRTPENTFVVNDLFVVIGLFAVPMNAFALYILHKYPRVMGDVACLYHKALAVTDTVTGLACMSWGLRFVTDSPYVALCVRGITNSMVINSLLLLTVISVDRFVAIKSPLRHLTLFPPNMALKLVVIVGSVSCIYFAIFASIRLVEDGASFIKESAEITNILELILIVISSIIFVVAAIVLTIFNILLLISLIGFYFHRGILKNRSKQPRLETLFKTARMVLAMTTAFYVSVLPITFVTLLYFFGYQVSVDVLYFVIVVVQFNCLFNPILYLMLNPSFFKAAVSSLSCRGGGSPVEEKITVESNASDGAKQPNSNI